MNTFEVNRDVSIGHHSVAHVFPKIPLRLVKVMSKLEVTHICVERSRWYSWIDPQTHYLSFGLRYLRNGKLEYIYLDLIHELTHLEQLACGQDVFKTRGRYNKRPTEIEAFRRSVCEARRLGLPREEIVSYLRLPWIRRSDFSRFCKVVGV